MTPAGFSWLLASSEAIRKRCIALSVQFADGRVVSYDYADHSEDDFLRL